MGDFSLKSASKKKKRKLRNPEDNQRPTKTHRIDEPELEKQPKEAEIPKQKEQERTIEAKAGRPWRNLQLILSLQSKQLDLQKKVELAFDYVNSRGEEGSNDMDEDCETVKVSRIVVFLNDWVQSLLISADKKVKVDGSGVIEACLDSRCWVIFKFCLEESLKLQVSLSFSRNLLRAVCCISRNAVSLLTNKSLDSKESVFVSEGFELYSVVLDCVSLVFLSHGGLLNDNLDLWILAVHGVLELVCKISNENLEGGDASVLALRFSCLMLEPFAKFLRVHPTKKNGFHDFVDKLLEPLLHLLGILRLRSDGSNPGWTENLLSMVEEVLSQGLFHQTHIDGFLSLRGTEKYFASRDGKMEDSKLVNKSYHRHLFDKLERLVAEKKESVLSGLGELLHLLVDRVKKQKGVSLLSEDTKMVGKTEGLRHLSSHMPTMLYSNANTPPENSYFTNSLSAEKRKSLIDFFVQIMEPLLLEMNGFLQTKLEISPILLDVNTTLKSINNLLASLLHEMLYVKTEDISEGASLSFLKKVYNTTFSFATNLLSLPTHDVDTRMQDILTSLARELLVAVGCCLEIEYEVTENDLTSLWLLMLSYLAFGHSFKDAPDQTLLHFQVLRLGCQLVKLYGELRQVESTIFALCRAIKLITVHENNDHGKLNCGSFGSYTTSIPYEAYAKSVQMLLCAHEFKHAIHSGIKSIPEGQVSDCIRQLSVDLSESMEWMKISCSKADDEELAKSTAQSCRIIYLVMQLELFGRGLSEMYALVLDSLTVTVGNSILVGRSIKDLMTIIRPCMSILVGLQPDSIGEFLSSVLGKYSVKGLVGNKRHMLKFQVPTHWVFVFFFHLFMSCRSLYRQAISLMPPDMSRKMSAVMEDPFTAYTGRDWMERTDWINDGYFSWIVQPSVSLLVIIQSISDICLQGSTADCCPLIYVLHAMALQRLVDLNRKLSSLQYIQKHNNGIVHSKSVDDAALSLYHKRSRKCVRHISTMKQEAAGLTEFMMSYLSLLPADLLSVNSSDNGTCLDALDQALHEGDIFSACSVNKKSLPTAIWWILCQNVDIWSTHASKKMLKMFLSHVIRTSVPSSAGSSTEVRKLDANEVGLLNKINVHQISSVLLTDSVLYELKFVRRYLASRFCGLLAKSALLLFSDFSIADINLSQSPNWQEVLSELENTSMVVSDSKTVTYDMFSKTKLSSSFEVPSNISRESTSLKFTTCQNLLGLLCWMPKGYMKSKSFSLYATHLLNLERLVIRSLLECQDALFSYKQCELLRLLVSCRRALQFIIMAYCEKKAESTQSLLIPMLSEESFPVLWLFKSLSVVVGLEKKISEDCVNEVRDMIFSLMDHTSYVFLTLSRYHFACTIHTINAKKPFEEQPDSEIVQQQSNLNKSGPSLDTSKDVEAWKSVFLLAETLKELTQGLLISLKNAPSNEKVGDGNIVVDLNKLSPIVSCFSGFLWGLASALNHINATDRDSKVKLLRWKCEPVSKINLCMNVFADFIAFSLQKLFVEDNYQPGNLCDAQTFQMSDDKSGLLSSEEIFPKDFAKTDILCDEHHKKSGAATNCSASYVCGDDCSNAVAHRRIFQLEDANTVAGVLNKVDSHECHLLNRLLQSLLKGDHPKAEILIRQLLIASSAVLRLNLQARCATLLSSLVPSFIGVCQVLLLKLVDGIEVPQPFSFIWLDGVLKYLQELGSYFPLTNPTMANNVYTKLIELYLKALGKCISLQGKEATLASHVKESASKTLHSHMGSCGASLSQMSYCLHEFKGRLRMTFEAFIRKPSELHLLSTMQAIERALVGVHEDWTTVYDINIGSTDGGKISSTVAAGIDCLDLVLEYVSGRKSLSVVKSHIHSLIAALFNIILHLQSPLIFCSISTGCKGDNSPDPGAVILMCVEVLTRISGKQALFQMDSWHVAQSLHIPAALFQEFCQLRHSEGPALSNSSLIMDNKDCDLRESISSCVVDRQFSIELFAACCRLLYTNVKHHKSETEQCIALLQESACVLLHCLETVDTYLSIRKGYFSWRVQEQVKCACFLRRIYEELRQQKETFGKHCYKFLCNYIWVYSGNGPLKTGIRREVDEALKPGVYALIDACSADDLQYLHSAFGEGPCRNALATLQHDYKQHFQYEGKV